MTARLLARLRLESLIENRYGRHVATNRQLPAILSVDALRELTGFTCLAVEHADPKGPLVVGLRETAGSLTSLYEVVEWRVPGHLDRSRWHFSVQRGWRQVTS